MWSSVVDIPISLMLIQLFDELRRELTEQQPVVSTFDHAGDAIYTAYVVMGNQRQCVALAIGPGPAVRQCAYYE